MKIGLYSITYLGLWYRGRALTLAEVVDRAAAIGYDGIEIDGKRPHGSPMDWDERARRELRERCAARGVEIVGVASNNDPNNRWEAGIASKSVQRIPEP